MSSGTTVRVLQLGPLVVQLAQAGAGQVGVAAAAVDGQGLGPGAGDGALELGQRIAGSIGAADVEVVVAAGHDVEDAGLPVAAGGRVGELPEHAVVAEDEVAIRGLALRLVDRGRVGVLQRGRPLRPSPWPGSPGPSVTRRPSTVVMAKVLAARSTAST